MYGSFTFKLRVWSSLIPLKIPLWGSLKVTLEVWGSHWHMTWVTTMRLIHNYTTSVRLTHTSVTLWAWRSHLCNRCEAHSFMCEFPPWGPLTVMLCMLVRLTHIYIMNVSTLSYPTSVRLTIMLHVRLICSYTTGVRLPHIYIKCVGSLILNLPMWGSLTVTLQVWGSLTFTLSVWAHSYLIYHCEAHSQLRYRCEAHSHHITRVTWITTVWLNQLWVDGSLTFTL